MPEDYPLLKDVYQERAQGTVNRRLPHFAGLAAVASIVTLMTALVSGFSDPVALIAGGVLLCALVTIAFLSYGIRSFDRIWDKNIEEFSTALNGPSILRSIEKELEYDTLQYPHVVFTPNYMITFKSFGDIFPVRDIELLEIVGHQPTSRDILAKTVYHFNCIAGPRHAFLSNDPEHIREIYLEITRRHPHVVLSESAEAYFFG